MIPQAMVMSSLFAHSNVKFLPGSEVKTIRKSHRIRCPRDPRFRFTNVLVDGTSHGIGQLFCNCPTRGCLPKMGVQKFYGKFLIVMSMGQAMKNPQISPEKP